MVEIKDIVSTNKFERQVRRIKDKSLKEKLKKQIKKIAENPSFGKPLRYSLKGERAIYIKPYRLIYSVVGEKLYLLKFEHRKKVYRFG